MIIGEIEPNLLFLPDIVPQANIKISVVGNSNSNLRDIKAWPIISQDGNIHIMNKNRISDIFCQSADYGKIVSVCAGMNGIVFATETGKAYIQYDPVAFFKYGKRTYCYPLKVGSSIISVAASLGRIHLLTTTGLVYTYGTNDRSPQLATGLTIDPILCPVTNIDQLGCSSDWSYIVTTNNKLYISNTDTWTYGSRSSISYPE